MSTWIVSRVPAEVAAFMQVASLLDRWRNIAEDNEKILGVSGEIKAADQTSELFLVAELAIELIRKYAGDLELGKISAKALQNRIGVLVVNNDRQETRAVAVWEVRGPKKISLDSLLSHPENIPSSLAKRVSGAASAAIQYLQEAHDEIRLTSAPTALEFYRQRKFVQIVGNEMIYSKGFS